MSSNKLFENKVTCKLFAYKSYIYIKTGFGIKQPIRVDMPQKTNQTTTDKQSPLWKIS